MGKQCKFQYSDNCAVLWLQSAYSVYFFVVDYQSCFVAQCGCEFG